MTDQFKNELTFELLEIYALLLHAFFHSFGGSDICVIRNVDLKWNLDMIGFFQFL